MTTVTCYLMFRWYYGPEFSGKALDTWAFEHGVQIEFTRPGKPTDNRTIPSPGKFCGRSLGRDVPGWRVGASGGGYYRGSLGQSSQSKHNKRLESKDF